MKVVNIRGLDPKHFEMLGIALIDRRTPYGNPFPMLNSSDRERDRVIGLFREYAEEKLKRQPRWLDELISWDLGCWCAPKRCHGDVIMELIERRRKEYEDELSAAYHDDLCSGSEDR